MESIYDYDRLEIDISINETKLDSSIGNSEIHLSGYDVVRLDRIRLMVEMVVVFVCVYTK